MAVKNEGEPILLNYTKYGVMFEIPSYLSHILVNAKPLEPISEYDYDERILRTVINYEFIDQTGEAKINEESPITLTIYITPEDFYFAGKNIDNIVIYDLKSTGVWEPKEILSRELIPPPGYPYPRSNFIGFVTIAINDFSDPPIAVGR